MDAWGVWVAFLEEAEFTEIESGGGLRDFFLDQPIVYVLCEEGQESISGFGFN